MYRLILASMICLLPFTLHAETQITDAWIKQLPPSVPVRAGYMTISNTGNSADRLLSVSSPAFKLVEMHESRMENGMMTMNELSDVTVPAGQTIEFKPGGMHLMMMGPRETLKLGEQIAATLTFESGSQTLNLTVRK